MDLETQLKARIPGYAGYADPDSRRLTDELVRSYLGESLARVAAAVPGNPALAGAVDELLMRTGFANQLAFSAFEEAAAAGVDARKLEAVDFRIVQLADEAGTKTPDLAAYVVEVRAALDERDRALSSPDR